MLNEQIAILEKETDLKDTVVIIEDSSSCAYRHERNLEKNGFQTKIFRDLEQFSMFITKPENAKRIKAIITDGLEGDWVGVVEIAQANHVQNIWLISGNQEFINRGKNIPGVTALSKGELENNLETYQKIVE